MSNITWQFQVSIPGGPAFTITQPNIAVEAYDVASANVGAGVSNIDIHVQPSSSPDDVVLVVVSSDTYDAGLTYKIDGGATAHALDAPHVMLGVGAVGFMNGGAPPQKLTFSSTLAKAANIQVVAGRKNP
ncbi:MAG: hypothetical protein CV088_02630 [Nitrospira sp. LK70]|nr:hypothetical protein [Nitrospira sp. LK70]